ncbi:hypothetical protein LH991_04190 [Schleiferilactobacillus harbinensis]|uniref:WxL domain-containing protein n=2 Tax=Schleiferilactobacillus harbinensis TaxID=304207 RepID=A0A0R1XJ57_9LACO|nr:pectate lyase-like adhesive domain-containing protein [Schleiferilactobacillus harbinensis]KRM29709.1 hypothetical protein FC91_GL000413 [Schleiferilactobacillus harbinensis DSM 16991]QFR63232.1 hypothetical protein LH991_04190 [Schleiferilactobacillus harbinensis]
MEHTNEVYKDIDPPSVWLSALVLAVFMIFAALVVHSGTCLADATETNYSPVRSNQFFSESKVDANRSSALLKYRALPIQNLADASGRYADAMTDYDDVGTYNTIQAIKAADNNVPTIVKTADQLIAALTNKNVHYIQLGANILMSGSAVSGYQSRSMLSATSGNVPARNFVIDGNQGQYTLEGNYWGNEGPEIYLNNTFQGTVAFNNIQLCGTSYWGPLTLRDQNGTAAQNTKLIYRNIDYQGSQLTASYYANVTFTGYNTVYCQKSYTGLDSSNNYSRTKAVTGYAYQENIEVSSVTFAKNTVYIGSSDGSGCISLGKWINYNGAALIDQNAQVTLSNAGNRGFTAWTQGLLVVNGTLTVSPYATLNVNLNNNTISGTPYNGITVDNYNSVKSNFVIADHAAVNINSDGPYNSYQSGGSIGTANIGGPLSIGTSSTVSVGQFAQLNVSAIHCNTPNPVIDGANGSNFLLSQYARFSLTHTSNGTAASNKTNGLLYMGSGSNFQFSRAFSVNVEDDTTAATYAANGGTSPALVYSPSGTLNVDTQNVYTWNKGNTNWGTDSSCWNNLANYDALYQSMFKMSSVYASSGWRSSTGSSTDQGSQTAFSAFNTDKLQRVQYTYVASVNINLNALTDKSTTVTGTVTTLDGLTGAEKPLAGAYVRVSGHVNNKNSNAIWTNGTTPTYTAAQVNADQPIAPATIVSPVANNPSLGTQYTANFNAVSGADGRFTINTAGNAPLMASNPSDTANASPTTNGRIQAYAFKNGNDSSTNTPVTDATPPVVTPYGSSEARSAVAAASAPLSAASFIKTATDFVSATGSNIWNKAITYQYDNSKNAADLWSAAGTNKPVYIIAADDQGNTTEVLSYVNIYQTTNAILVGKPTVVMKQLSTVPANWRQWSIDTNQVTAFKILANGTITQIPTSLIQSTASNAINQLGQHQIQYSLPASYGAQAVTGMVTFKSDTLSLKVDANPLDFGKHAFNIVGALFQPVNSTYAVQVDDDRVQTSQPWSLSVSATPFVSQSTAVQVSTEQLNLGLMDQANYFNSIMGTPFTVANDQTGSQTFDFINGPLDFCLNNATGSSGLNGHYTATMTWVLTDGL